MITVKKIAFSCYPVTDMARARKFYEGVPGLKASMTHGQSGEMQWTEYELGTGTLSLGSGAPGWNPVTDGCCVTLEVTGFAAAIAHLRAQGVRFKVEPFPTPVCQMAFVLDPDGNTVGIHQRKAAH